MTKSDFNKLVDYWKKGSQLNFDSSIDIANKSRRYVEALFFLHLTIEKILKAYYVKNKKDHAPYSHNLLFLAQNADLSLSTEHRKLLAEINEFNIECRYPDAKFEIYKRATKELFDKYLIRTTEFREWILNKLK